VTFETPPVASGRGLTRREVIVTGSVALVAWSQLGRLARADASLDAAASRRWALGAFVNPSNQRLTFAKAQRAIDELESLIGHPLRIVSSFVAWEEPFPNASHLLDRRTGRRPLIAWDGSPDLRAVSTGRWDSLLRTRARSCRDFGGTIYVRWAPEFNGEWNPCYGRAREFVAAWRHVVSLFRTAGARNVKWVWCPFAVQGQRRPADKWRRYYPGDEFVDWVGMDGYNWGTARAWSKWQTFGEIFAPLYADYAGRRPLMICELACTELGGDKAVWIRDMGARLAGRFSKVRAVVWFDTDKETDWRVNSSAASLRAFRSIL
jgi:Glycosyl hydrolase family 26